MLSLASVPLAFSAPLAVPASRAAAPQMMAKSKALPFLECPSYLDGTYAGDAGFDPLGFSAYYDIKWMREAEVKHGRICMLACAGYVLVDLGFYAPGAPHVSSLEAHDVAVKSGHMLLLLFVIAMFEALSYNAISEMMSGESDRQPGDYGIPYNAATWGNPNDPKLQEKYKLAEIIHGRAAMLGFSGMVTGSALNEATFPYDAVAAHI